MNNTTELLHFLVRQGVADVGSVTLARFFKAFDTVDHKLFLVKLGYYNLFLFVLSFLISCSQ